MRNNIDIERYVFRGVAFAVIAAVFYARLRYLNVPFERDEGEYAYGGWLLLQGILPYEQMYTVKLPGIHVIYALIMGVFGETVGGVRLGLLFVSAVSTALVFLLARRLRGEMAGLVAAAVFAVLSMGHMFLGFTANAEHFVLPFVLGGLILILIAAEKEKRLYFFLGGLLLGVGYIVKQHALFFILFAAACLLWRFYAARGDKAVMTKRFGDGVYCALGAVLPFVAVCLVYVAAGTFDKFWFWTFDYARSYVSMVPLSRGASMLAVIVKMAASFYPFVFLLFVIGLVAPLWDKSVRAIYPYAALFFLFSFFSVCPGLYFRSHYFLLLVPAVAILCAIGLAALEGVFSGAKKKMVSVFVAVLVFGQLFYSGWNYLFVWPPELLPSGIYQGQPYAEAVVFAEQIKKNTANDDTVAILGSEPQILFYSGRKSATSYVYMYPLTERHKYADAMQREVTEQIEGKKPGFLVLAWTRFGWYNGQDNGIRNIFDWSGDYIGKNYSMEGFVRLDNMHRYYWGDGVKGVPRDKNGIPDGEKWMALFKRKDAAWVKAPLVTTGKEAR
ncbi:MAG: glycosyltransferase family 39 protein [Deltaproteobacteria bacterium]|nr:glycosyltransferase family 39 protein [Deltaproteobacteria bacterium]